MLASLMRPARVRRRRDRSPFSSSYAPTARSPDTSRSNTRRDRRMSSDPYGRDAIQEESEEEDDAEIDDEDDADDDGMDDMDEEDGLGDEDADSDEDGPEDTTPLLPLFLAAHLDAIPVFALTHAIRTLVTSRCDTVLTWEQLRSPQVSQFLLKPIEQEIRSNHLNAATQYALMANFLQYQKEAALSSGNSGTNRTRAMVCELLAIKLLKDYSTRELIDALSYDFDPLQGHGDAVAVASHDVRAESNSTAKKPLHRPARISCFEIAIRGQAKKFLSHPTVVKQLEAIWAGTIVFHSAADNMHRKLPLPSQLRSYGTNNANPSTKNVAALTQAHPTARRAVTLYNPRDASLFKLSRLRVPRYRNILSTLSFAILLALFVAVLVQRSLEITPLEVVFWFWAAGFMLDEIVGFNEQGFSLYLASFWNVFDLGILLVLVLHLLLRIYGIVMPDVRKHTVANMAYDLLAADAILLFPRLFSVLDHYRYFSPLLIAFRYMATDLMAVSLLILISCSGFFVALTLSFGNEGVDTPSSVAYALLQMVMGFTPAAWDRWDSYNALGKFILTLFLFICHFLVVTILITVLTNSFMAIVQNANEEHQFLFAVNTISHVKSDALFSFVAPTNILQWAMVPLRYFVPFRQYVKINRTVIKITHFPLLFTIFLYEKIILQSTVFDTMDLVERRGRLRRSAATKLARLNRAPSIATFRQDRALEEVFRQPFDSTVKSALPSRDRRKASNVVNSWMKNMGDDIANPPQEQDRQIVDGLEARGLSSRRLRPLSRIRDFSHRTMSIASDPEDFAAHADFLSPGGRTYQEETTPSAVGEPLQQTDADGDDELRTNDEDDDHEEATSFDHRSTGETEHDERHRPEILKPHDYFSTKSPKVPSPDTAGSVGSYQRSRLIEGASGTNSPLRSSMKAGRPRHHSRNVSTATMIFKPVGDSGTDKSSSRGDTTVAVSRGQKSTPGSGARSPISKPGSNATGARTPKRPAAPQQRTRPVLPTQDEAAFRSTPNLAGLIETRRPVVKRRPSLEMDLVSDIGDNRAIGGGYVGALPTSFAAQMAQASNLARNKELAKRQEEELFTKIMMARMNSLEEGFREVIHEMRESMKERSRSQSRDRSRREREKPTANVKEKRGKDFPKGKEKSVTVPSGNKDTPPAQDKLEDETPTQAAHPTLPNVSATGVETGPAD